MAYVAPKDHHRSKTQSNLPSTHCSHNARQQQRHKTPPPLITAEELQFIFNLYE
ncbi:hypothetical protein JYB87_05275 [Shewanella avicenniae]|uniref:Uncharacterized protein n=1 Tax=Shewanella avicenniae TaxID=2814294 RepID=A0ABX7QUQ3_9GAMM|nr:hypothetical protein [Shewanella avicenniae]QSX34650.1 hypothetical protein JYB87_05275 [Shewanella avicenniae]